MQTIAELGGIACPPETEYYGVCYIPSEDLSGCFGKTRGTMEDGSIFYREIGEHLYYCIAHF